MSNFGIVRRIIPTMLDRFPVRIRRVEITRKVAWLVFLSLVVHFLVNCNFVRNVAVQFCQNIHFCGLFVTWNRTFSRSGRGIERIIVRNEFYTNTVDIIKRAVIIVLKSKVQIGFESFFYPIGRFCFDFLENCYRILYFLKEFCTIDAIVVVGLCVSLFFCYYQWLRHRFEGS